MAGKTKDDLAECVWRLTPSDFLPADEQFWVGGYAFRLYDGLIKTKILKEGDKVSPTILAEIEKHMRFYLDAVQLEQHRFYRVRLDSVVDRQGLRVFPEPAGEAEGCASVYVKVIDVDGAVIYDAKEEKRRVRQEQICRLQQRAELLSKHQDDRCLQAMKRSYEAACADPSNELVHLYEIRDSIVWRFKGKADACQSLGIDEGFLDSLHKTCNDRPLAQGRHRGRFYEVLRPSEAEELEEARRTCRRLLEAYLTYLEGAFPST